jgi:hypothetical protein
MLHGSNLAAQTERPVDHSGSEHLEASVIMKKCGKTRSLYADIHSLRDS